MKPGLKPVTVSPAMVVEPVKLTGPETVRDEIVEVPAVKVPPTLALPAIEALPETVNAPWMFAVCVVRLPEDKLVKPAIEPPVKSVAGFDGT